MPRQHDRKPLVVEVDLQNASGNGEARISDISVAGCYVDTIVGVNIGEEVAFEMVNSGGEKHPFLGRVAFHTPGVGFGLEFVDLSDEQKLFLANILQSI